MKGSSEMKIPGSAENPPAASLSRVTSILAIPYGYTVSLGCAALLSVARFGAPAELDVFLFGLGGVAAFVSLAWLGKRHLDPEIPMRVPALVVLNLCPLAAILAILALPASLPGRGLGYFLDAFVVTAAYLLCLALVVRCLSGGTAGRR
jgi:hypothetical protein